MSDSSTRVHPLGMHETHLGVVRVHLCILIEFGNYNLFCPVAAERTSCQTEKITHLGAFGPKGFGEQYFFIFQMHFCVLGKDKKILQLPLPQPSIEIEEFWTGLHC